MNNKFKNVLTLGGFIIVAISAVFVVIASNDSKGELQLSQGVTAVSFEVSGDLMSSGNLEGAENEGEDGKMVVFILGAVNEPGIVRVKEDTRLYEVVALAGGPTADADLAKVNLASFVWDEEKIVIPYRSESYTNSVKNPIVIEINEEIEKIEETGEIEEIEEIEETEVIEKTEENLLIPFELDYGYDYFKNYDFEADESADANSNSNSNAANKIVNINTASALELTALSGIGDATAEKIIEYRNANGKFQSIEEIKNVKGIGEAKFNKIKANISV